MKRSIFVIALFCYFAGLASQAHAQEFAPLAFTQFRGINIEGGLEEFAFSDDEYVVYQPGFVLNSCELRVWLIFDFELDTDQPSELFVSYETSVDTPNIFLAMHAVDWAGSPFNFDETIVDFGDHPCGVGSEEVPFGFDAVRTIDLSDRIPRIVEPLTGNVRLRLGWDNRGFLALINPWNLEIDQVALFK